MKTYFENLNLNEMEEAVDEYERIKDTLYKLSRSTEYINIDFLIDMLMDEYMDDIDEMQDILNREENGEISSPEEDYRDNVIIPTMRGIK